MSYFCFPNHKNLDSYTPTYIITIKKRSCERFFVNFCYFYSSSCFLKALYFMQGSLQLPATLFNAESQTYSVQRITYVYFTILIYYRGELLSTINWNFIGNKKGSRLPGAYREPECFCYHMNIVLTMTAANSRMYTISTISRIILRRPRIF